MYGSLHLLHLVFLRATDMSRLIFFFQVQKRYYVLYGATPNSQARLDYYENETAFKTDPKVCNLPLRQISITSKTLNSLNFFGINCWCSRQNFAIGRVSAYIYEIYINIHQYKGYILEIYGKLCLVHFYPGDMYYLSGAPKYIIISNIIFFNSL